MGKNKLKKFAEMETFSNVFQFPMSIVKEQPPKIVWRGYFRNDHPIVLELGCGRGEYTVALGQVEPDRNFIGIDIKGARMWAGAREALQLGLQNVAFLRTNIENLPAFFSEDEVSEIWITFPDPQMKKATKRLTSTYFLKRYQQFMQDGGIVNLKTDSPFLYTYTSELVRLNQLEVLVETDDLYGMRNEELGMRNEELATQIQTHYEKQWLSRGMTIKYLRFRLPKTAELQEPEIEIEKDTYRSYGRNYVSTTDN